MTTYDYAELTLERGAQAHRALAEALAERAGSDGARRLLPLTRYGSHDVWEKSRSPSTDAMRMFLRRQQLTRATLARSSLLVTS